ncbi:DUF3866 family protein [Actinomyces naeslundii]|uniref:DUF3866 family protein n=1 Tax=Actinomyces naeslundii TaxID=1655 RepID=UPI00096F9C96|nr:DUF3866 family protein [Actinomyces naeslundii]OMG21586.1 hypothetical protein BKH37_08770 [Actinomyces naeslundii]OMG27956.1 hypothetical protein BKH34_12145 [Actinomyces naeslundii]OMG29173.1 hypothetical protein BKH35_05805 [Actinomyces naeslundii]OMG40737.1 hypothetical protein BKH14_02930 [Actinomyces naeslundii]OMG42628.1 hypothetical protein BKH03_01805 [Actinomyces naeslundii]
MMWRDGVVSGARTAWGPAGRSCAELDVEITGAPKGASSLMPGLQVRAVAYEALTGVPVAGERVRLEVSALDRALGTGGHAMVSARLDALPADPPREGHLVKARYMPDQVMVTGVDEQGTTHHGLLSQPIGDVDLEGMPVVVADLHSSLPAVLAGLRSPDGARQPRVVYVMTDGGALPLAYSRLVAALSEAGWLAGTVTAGQAWGGDIEAVSVHNALLAARHVLHADAAIVIQGPGNLGTETPWGFSGVACGDAVNAIATLGGRPVACLRVSQADARPRHLGISHHSMTAYGRVALAGADVVVPILEGALGAQVRREAEVLCEPRPGAAQHRLVEVPADGLMELLRAAEAETGVRLSTMRRGLDEDTAAFIAAAAAGRHVRRILDAEAVHG